MNVEQPMWQTSSFSSNGSCVAVNIQADTVMIRNSRIIDDAELRFTPDEWVAFLSGVKAGEFDLG